MRGIEPDYNLRLGPVRLKLDAVLELEYDDNVNVADDRLTGEFAPKEDFFIRPLLNVGASWQVTDLNRLTLNLGFGYEFSLNDTRESEVSPFTVSPDSEIAFDVFIGDVRLNFHDRFSVDNNPSSQATLSNTSGYSRFLNEAGVLAIWDLNDLVVSGGYDFIIERFSGTVLGLSDRDTHRLQLSVAFLLDETTTTGIQSSASFIEEKSAPPVEEAMYTLGPFLEFQISPFTRFLLAAGVMHFESDGDAVDEEDFGPAYFASRTALFAPGEEQSVSETTYYWTASVVNKLNLWYTHSITAGHERQIGLGALYVDIDYARYLGEWLVNSNVTAQFIVAFGHFAEERRIAPETLDRWEFGFGLSYQIQKNFSTSLRYSHFSKESDLEFADYTQNVVTIGFKYDF